MKKSMFIFLFLFGTFFSIKDVVSMEQKALKHYNLPIQTLYQKELQQRKKEGCNNLSAAVNDLTQVMQNLVKKIKQNTTQHNNQMRIYQSMNDDFNLPIQSLIMPQIEKIKNNAHSNDFFMRCTPSTKKSLIFDTKLLARLFFSSKEIFDSDGYHSMPSTLMDLLLTHGRVDNRLNDYSMTHFCFGLMCYPKLRLSEKGLINMELHYESVKARILTKNLKKQKVIFHTGIEKIKYTENNYYFKIKNKFCLEIKKQIVPKDEQRVLAYIAQRKKMTCSLYINLNAKTNTISFDKLNEMFGPYFVKKLSNGTDLLMFPCPNESFFVTISKYMGQMPQANM